MSNLVKSFINQKNRKHKINLLQWCLI